MQKKYLRYAVGLDMSKDRFHACIMGLTPSESRKIIASRSFSNSSQGFRLFVKWIKSKCKESDTVLRMLMEVTGVYHESLLHFLHKQGYHVSLELGRRTKAYFKSLGQKTKTDRVDAKGLASMALDRKLKPWQPVSEQIYHIRQLIRHRDAMVDQRTSLKNQLHAQKYTHSGNKEVIGSLKRMIKKLDQEIQKAEQQAQELLEKDPQLMAKTKKITASLNGVAILTMIRIIAETDGFNLFTSRKQLTSYAGYDIVENQSGKVSGKTRISKKGNARIRKAMYMPTLAHLRAKKGPLYQLYLRLLQSNGGLRKKAQVAVQRKLLCLIFTLWKKDQQYDPQFINKHNQKESSSETNPELREIHMAQTSVP